jgi:ATP-binding protein involved in chromosome partitioning
MRSTFCEEPFTVLEEVRHALESVVEPHLDRPITELGMVDDVSIDGATVAVRLILAVPGSPLTDDLLAAVRDAVHIDGVADVHIQTSPMTEAQQDELVQMLRPNLPAGADGSPAIPFNTLESTARVIAVASGKGGVGKSSITTNLAVALARAGHKVGILDADIWGYSIPRMMGITGRPMAFGNMVLPLHGHGCKVISIGFFIDTERPVIWRGPMLHRALQQFLADVHWGNLDFLLCDLPPGTGDIAISLAQMLPSADMLVVTTPQPAAQRVALRAGQTTAQTGMRVGGVIENMATFIAPDTGKEYRIFGEGGGQLLADELGTTLLGSIPIDLRLREGADDGVPLVAGDPEAPASKVLIDIAGQLAARKQSVAGKRLPLLG